MDQLSLGTVAAGGAVLPAELRREFGIEDGSEVVFSRTEHGIELKTVAEVVRQAQQRLARCIRPGESVMDELIRDRRAAAHRKSSHLGRIRPARLAVPGTWQRNGSRSLDGIAGLGAQYLGNVKQDH